MLVFLQRQHVLKSATSAYEKLERNEKMKIASQASAYPDLHSEDGLKAAAQPALGSAPMTGQLRAARQSAAEHALLKAAPAPITSTLRKSRPNQAPPLLGSGGARALTPIWASDSDTERDATEGTTHSAADGASISTPLVLGVAADALSASMVSPGEDRPSLNSGLRGLALPAASKHAAGSKYHSRLGASTSALALHSSILSGPAALVGAQTATRTPLHVRQRSAAATDHKSMGMRPSESEPQLRKGTLQAVLGGASVSPAQQAARARRQKQKRRGNSSNSSTQAKFIAQRVADLKKSAHTAPPEASLHARAALHDTASVQAQPSSSSLLSRRHKRSITILDPLTDQSFPPRMNAASAGSAGQPDLASTTDSKHGSWSSSHSPQHFEASPFMASRTLQRRLEQHVHSSALQQAAEGKLPGESDDDSASTVSEGGRSASGADGSTVSHPLFPRDNTTNVYFGNLVSLQAEDGQFLTVDPRSGVVAFQTPTAEWERRGIEPFSTFAVASALQAWGASGAKEGDSGGPAPHAATLSGRSRPREMSRQSHRQPGDGTLGSSISGAASRKGLDTFTTDTAPFSTGQSSAGAPGIPTGRVPTEGLPAGMAAKVLGVASQRTVTSLVRAAGMMAAAERARVEGASMRQPPPPPPAAPLYIFRVIDITAPKNSAALQYGCNLWLQVVAGNGTAGWISGSVLGVHVARPTELASISQGVDQHGDVGPNGSALPPGLLDITLQEALVQNSIRESVQETEQNMRAAQHEARYAGAAPPETAQRQISGNQVAANTRMQGDDSTIGMGGLADLSGTPNSDSVGGSRGGSPASGLAQDAGSTFLTQSSSVQMLPPQALALGDGGSRLPEDTPADDEELQPLTRHTAMNAPPPETTVGAIALFSSAPSATKRRPRREIEHDPELRDMLSPSTAWNTDVALVRVGDAALVDEQSTWNGVLKADSAQDAVAASAMLPLLNTELPPRSAAAEWADAGGASSAQLHAASKGSMLVVRPTRSATRKSRRRSTAQASQRDMISRASSRGSVSSAVSRDVHESEGVHDITGFALEGPGALPDGSISGRSSAGGSDTFRSARRSSTNTPEQRSGKESLGSPRVLAVTGPPHIPTYASSAIEAAVLSNVQRKRRVQFLASALDVAGEDIGVPRPIPAVVPGKGVVTAHSTGVLMGEPSVGNVQGVYTFGTPSFMALVDHMNSAGRLVGKWTVTAAMRTHPSNSADAGSVGPDKKKKKRHKGRYEESSSDDDDADGDDGPGRPSAGKAPRVVSKREQLTRANQRDVRNMDWIVLSHGSLFLAAHPHEGDNHASLVRDGEETGRKPKATPQKAGQDTVHGESPSTAGLLPAAKGGSGLTPGQRNLLRLLRPDSRMAHLCMHSLRFLRLTSQSSAAHQAAMWRRIHMTSSGKDALATLDEMAHRRHVILGRKLHFALQDGFTQQVRARSLAKTQQGTTQVSASHVFGRPSAAAGKSTPSPAPLLPRGSSFARSGGVMPGAFGQSLRRSPSRGGGQMNVVSGVSGALRRRPSSNNLRRRNSKPSWQTPSAGSSSGVNDLSSSALQGVEQVEGDDSDSGGAGSDSSTSSLDALGLNGDDEGGIRGGVRGIPSALSAAESVPHSGPRGRFMVPLRGMLRIRLVAVSESSAVGGGSLQLAASAAAAATAGQQPNRPAARSRRVSHEGVTDAARISSPSQGQARAGSTVSGSRGLSAAATRAPSLSAVVNTVAARSAGAGMSAPVGQFELLASHQLAQSRLQRRGRSKRQSSLSTAGYTGSSQALLHGTVGGVAAAARGEAHIANTTRMQLLPDVQQGQHRAALLRKAAAKRRAEQEAAIQRRRHRGQVDPSVTAMKRLLRKVHRVHGMQTGGDTPSHRDQSYISAGMRRPRAGSLGDAWSHASDDDSEEDVAAAVARGLKKAAMEHTALGGGRHLASSILANNDTALKIANADFVKAVMQQQQLLQRQAQDEAAQWAASPGVSPVRGVPLPRESALSPHSLHAKHMQAGQPPSLNRSAFRQDSQDSFSHNALGKPGANGTWVVPGTPAHRLASLNRYIESASGSRVDLLGCGDSTDHARMLSFVLRGEHANGSAPVSAGNHRPTTSSSTTGGSSMYLNTAGALFQQDEQVSRQLQADKSAAEAAAQAMLEASVPAKVRAAQRAMHHAQETRQEDKRVQQLDARQAQREARARESDDEQLQEHDIQVLDTVQPAAGRENTKESVASRAGSMLSSQPGRRVPLHGTAAHVERGVMSPDNIASVLDSVPVAMKNSWEQGLRSELELEALVRDMKEQTAQHLSMSPEKMRLLRSAVGKRELPSDHETKGVEELQGAVAADFARHLQNEDTRMHVLLGIEHETGRAKQKDTDTAAATAEVLKQPSVDDSSLHPRRESPTAAAAAGPTRTRSVLQSMREKLDRLK